MNHTAIATQVRPTVARCVSEARRHRRPSEVARQPVFHSRFMSCLPFRKQRWMPENNLRVENYADSTPGCTGGQRLLAACESLDNERRFTVSFVHLEINNVFDNFGIRKNSPVYDGMFRFAADRRIGRKSEGASAMASTAVTKSRLGGETGLS